MAEPRRCATARSTPSTGRSARAWRRSAAGRCRSSTRACSRSTARAASTRSSSTCRTSGRCASRAPGAVDDAPVGVHERPRPHRARAGAVHAPARPRRRARRRRHHRVVGRRRRVPRDAERVEHRRRSSPRSRTRSPAHADGECTSRTSPRRRAVLAVQGPEARERLGAVAAGDGPTCRGSRCSAAAFDGEPGWVGRHRLHGRGRRRAPRARGRRAGGVAARLARRRHRARPASAPATRCGSKPGCRCTATSSAPASRRSRRAWRGSCASTRATSAAGTPLVAERDRGVAPPAARPARRRPADPARPATRCSVGERARGRGDERQLLARARAGDRASRSCRPTSPTAPPSPSTSAGRAVRRPTGRRSRRFVQARLTPATLASGERRRTRGGRDPDRCRRTGGAEGATLPGNSQAPRTARARQLWRAGDRRVGLTDGESPAEAPGESLRFRDRAGSGPRVVATADRRVERAEPDDGHPSSPSGPGAARPLRRPPHRPRRRRAGAHARRRSAWRRSTS